MPFVSLSELQVAARLVSIVQDRCWMIYTVGRNRVRGPGPMYDGRYLAGYSTAEFSIVVF